LRHGPNITYYENGKTRYSGIYKNDVRDSIWVYYDSVGNVAERAVYKNDQIIRKLGPGK
jgi:antitoxin component YwqK of YwqJK toxin-antitoxin module